MDCLTSLLYPPYARCYACGYPRLDGVGDHLCPACRAEIEKLRRKDDLPFLVEGIEKVYAPFRYDGAVKALVHCLKYDCVRDAAGLLGREMAQRLGRAAPNAVVPVPLHRKNLRERGFNQALLLGREIALDRGIPVLEALKRVRDTGQQAKLDKFARMRNVEGAFAACLPVEGMRLMLVDDVCTTGATARACAIALRMAGAKAVSLCVTAVDELYI